jgi:hypothetical protein
MSVLSQREKILYGIPPAIASINLNFLGGIGGVRCGCVAGVCNEPCEQGVTVVFHPVVHDIVEKRREGMTHFRPRPNPKRTHDISPANGKVAHTKRRPSRKLGRKRRLKRIEFHRTLGTGARLAQSVTPLQIQKLECQRGCLARARPVKPSQQPAHSRRRCREMPVVIPHKSRRPVGHLMGKRQAEKNVPTDVRPHALMAAKVPVAILVNGHAHGLACIMQERSPPQRLRGHAAGKRLDSRAHPSGMLQKVIRVIGAVLV